MHRSTFRSSLLLTAALCLPLFGATARADERASQMRGLINKYGAGVVAVSVTIKTSYSPEQMEMEVPGLVVESSGLVVVTNMSIDPMSSMGSLMGGDTSGMSTSVVSAKYLLPEGVEVPAKLVLRDRDRNLAFLRPLHPVAGGLTSLDFKGSDASAQIADPVLILGRLGKTGGRGSTITEDRLTAVLQKPRTLYGLSYMTMTHMGEAAFTEKGEFLGMVSIRVAKSKSGARSMNVSDMMMTTVIPAADVWEVALQAPKVDAVPATAPPSKPTPAKLGTKTKPAAAKPGVRAAPAPGLKPK